MNLLWYRRIAKLHAAVYPLSHAQPVPLIVCTPPSNQHFQGSLEAAQCRDSLMRIGYGSREHDIEIWI